MGKIVTAYNEGQCDINAGHSWKSGDEIFWGQDKNDKTITCNNKACFLNQGGEADGDVKVTPEKPSQPKQIEKSTGHHTTAEIQENDRDIHGGGEGEGEHPGPEAGHDGSRVKVKTMDVVDIAAEKMLLEFVTYAKEVKIIETAVKEVFEDNAPGEKIGMITRMLWEYKNQKL